VLGGIHGRVREKGRVSSALSGFTASMHFWRMPMEIPKHKYYNTSDLLVFCCIPVNYFSIVILHGWGLQAN